MIAMFDKDRTGSINFDEFANLWRYVTDWLNCFRSFDRDNSGNIDPKELRQALTTFGYRFSDNFLDILMKRYDREGKGKKSLKNNFFALFAHSLLCFCKYIDCRQC